MNRLLAPLLIIGLSCSALMAQLTYQVSLNIKHNQLFYTDPYVSNYQNWFPELGLCFTLKTKYNRVPRIGIQVNYAQGNFDLSDFTTTYSSWQVSRRYFISDFFMDFQIHEHRKLKASIALGLSSKNLFSESSSTAPFNPALNFNTNFQGLSNFGLNFVPSVRYGMGTSNNKEGGLTLQFSCWMRYFFKRDEYDVNEIWISPCVGVGWAFRARGRGLR